MEPPTPPPDGDPPRSHGPYDITARRLVYENPWIRVREDRVVHRQAGSAGLFGIVTLVAGATVLALDDQGTVTLVREFKYALGAWSLELVSGGLDAGEAPLEAAKRELREEVGLTADRWTDLGVLRPFSTTIASANHMFLARGLTAVAASPDAWEGLELVRLPLAEAVEHAMDGRIVHAASCVALLKTERLLTPAAGA